MLVHKEKRTYANGDVYIGEFFEGLMQGKGKYTWANGNVYEGDFINEEMHGNGKITAKNGDIIQEGKFEYGLFIG